MVKESKKVENLKNQLKQTQSMTKQYLEIIKNFKKNHNMTQEELDFIVSKSGIIQLKIMKLKPELVKITYERPFNLGTYPDYELLSNFPILLRDHRLRDEAHAIIPAIESGLSTYLNMVDEIINTPKMLKNLLKRKKETKKLLQILKEDKKLLFEILFIPIYIVSLTLLLNTQTFIFGLIFNIISVGFIITLTLLSKVD